MDFGSLTMLELALAALAGAAVGFLSGVFGIGGSFLLVPVLNIALKIPMELAVGAGACHVLGPATTSLLARRIERETLRLPLTITGGLLVGVVAGVRALEWTKHHGKVVLPGKSASLTELVVLGTYFVLMLSLGLFAIWEVRRTRQNRQVKRGWVAGWRLPPFAEFPEFSRMRVSISALALFGLTIGYLAGLLGMSGGLVLLPGLIYLLGLKTQQSVMSSLVIVWLVAAQATAVHAWHGNIDITLVMALLAGGTIGARLGSDFSVKLQSLQLRQGFAWLLLGTATLIALRLGRLALP